MCKKFMLWFTMFLCCTLSAQNNHDSLKEIPRNTLRFEVAGRAIVGMGFTFERAWRNPDKVKHPRAFNSVDVNASWTLLEYSIISIGLHRNWMLGKEGKWVINCGIAPAVLICFNPTPKRIREYQDANPQYGQGRYVNPLEPWLLGSFSCRYSFDRLFIQASITPFVYYDRAYQDVFVWAPWGGLSVGINLKSNKN